MITNPIIKGFNPDPSIIRVKNDFYIACSTFEWFPGVAIHHSTDLANWELITYPLDSKEMLNMQGIPDSCGVWAPCLSYSNGIFYLVFTNVQSFYGFDTPNYLTTATSIYGPWSKPVFLNAKGFDPSFFHDDDGRIWYLSMLADHRRQKLFGGIILQEYDTDQKKLKSPIYNIFEGSKLGITEGPHIYKKDNYYYLITAEGGTEYGHAVTIARSKNITGPYEIHPQNPIISARNHPDHPIQKTGHADIVQTKEGEYFIVFLAGRPLSKLGRCTLGRETCIEALEWKEGEWPQLENGNALPRLRFESKDRNTQNRKTHERIDFSVDKLSIHYQSLRIPQNENWITHDIAKNSLSLKGRNSLFSTIDQSLMARRVQSFEIEYITAIDFKPVSFQQMAGIVCYYNTGHHFYLHIMGDDDSDRKYINIIQSNNYQPQDLLPEYVDVSLLDTVYLKIHWKRAELHFYYSHDGENWIRLGESHNADILSDDYVREGSNVYRPAFTGSFVGIACQDLAGESISAHFNFVEYKER